MTAADDTDPAPEALADPRAAAVAEIDVALGRLRRSMLRRGLGRRVVDELGLEVEPAVVEVVDAVAEADRPAGGVAIGAVAARLAVDPSQASRLVADAVRAGFVERLASQADGRRSALALTAAGEALLAATRQRKRALLLAHVAGWDDAELVAFARLLDRFSTLARG